MGVRMVLLGLWALALSACATPAPTGQYGVGRSVLTLVDRARPETLSLAGGPRETPLVVWRPAAPGARGDRAYVPRLSTIRKDLVASGEVSRLEAMGLGLVRSPAVMDAPWPMGSERFPVLLLSPGGATNVEFYDALASDLASRGYVVIGVNHPYDVAAVRLTGGSVARYVEGPMPPNRQPWMAQRMAERTADLLFVLAQLDRAEPGAAQLPRDRLDLTRIGAFGHSLGGITAAQACAASRRIAACANLDGLQAGGPWSAGRVEPIAQPFAFITKEKQLNPQVMAAFARAPSTNYLVVVEGAIHQNFGDGELLKPGKGRANARAVIAATRQYLAAFFDQTLRGIPSQRLARASREDRVSVTLFSTTIAAHVSP